jgi:hypothetical protein
MKPLHAKTLRASVDIKALLPLCGCEISNKESLWERTPGLLHLLGEVCLVPLLMGECVQ